MFGSRILLLAPHPDDEVVGACAAIQRVRKQGCVISILFLTTGVPSRERLWFWNRASHGARVEQRMKEARRACGELGIGIAGFATVAARELKDTLFQSRRLIGEAIVKLKADTLWAPAYEGGHPDHDLANFLASTVRDDVNVWECSEYNHSGGRVQCNEFPFKTGQEKELLLSDDERVLKKKLLETYASECSNLSYVRTEREVFRPIAEYDYSRPPHDGTLFYERYAWAAFHPRVNHIRNAEVARAIAEYGAGS
jgi:LmbE family N-acetylglucosaminyl deacetylase